MTIFRSIQKKVEKSLLTRGFLGTIGFTAFMAFRFVRNLSPRSWQSRAIERAADEAFDSRYGVDTGGVIPLSNLKVTATNWIFGGAYQAVGRSVDFGAVLKELAVPYEEFTFLDLGSGKGRAVLLASSIPFKKIVGIEFSEELHRIAEDNVRRWPDEVTKCGQIELICMDAEEYCFPEGPFVLYMYNPFGRPVMKGVVENVTAAFQEHPRRIVVVYFTPKHSDLWEGVKFLKRVLVRPGYHVYDT